jgi:hypothetical protein
VQSRRSIRQEFEPLSLAALCTKFCGGAKSSLQGWRTVPTPQDIVMAVSRYLYHSTGRWRAKAADMATMFEHCHDIAPFLSGTSAGDRVE